MDATQLDSLNQFIDELSPDDFDNLSQKGKAKVFIWFGQEVLDIPLTGDEIEACYIQVGLNIPPKSIESQIQKDPSILKLPGNTYGFIARRPLNPDYLQGSNDGRGLLRT
jgi:hypothetical protein